MKMLNRSLQSFIIWSLGFQLRTNKATLPYISWNKFYLIYQLSTKVSSPNFASNIKRINWNQFHLKSQETYGNARSEICRLSPAAIYLLKVNYRNSRARCDICSKLTITFTPCSSVSIVNFEHVIAGWVPKEILHIL